MIHANAYRGAPRKVEFIAPPRREPVIRPRETYAPYGTRRAQIMFDLLDRLSRDRALTDAESVALQNAMRALGMI